MDRTTKKQLTKLSHDQHVLINGVVRNRRTFKSYRIRKSTLQRLMACGYLTIENTVLKVTPKAHSNMHPKPKASVSKRSADYYEARRDRGYVRRQVWVHHDDLDAFEVMMKERFARND